MFSLNCNALRGTVLCLCLAFPAVLRASSPCEEGRLGTRVMSLTQVLKGAEEKQVLKLDELKRFSESTDWSNPFLTASQSLNLSSFSRAFAQLEKDLSSEDRDAVKLAVKHYLVTKGKLADVGATAQHETERVLAPMEVAVLKYMGSNIGDDRVFQRGLLDGRPVFVELTLVTRGDLAVILDPLNPRESKRVVTIPIKRLGNWKALDGYYVNLGGRDLMVYPKDYVVIDLKAGKDVSQDFAPKMVDKIHAGVQSNLKQNPTGEIEWKALSQVQVTFRQSGKELATLNLPEGGKFYSENGQRIKTVDSGQGAIALVPYRIERTPYILIADLHAPKVAKSYQIGIGDTLGSMHNPSFGATFRKGHLLLYWVSFAEAEDEYELNILDTVDGSRHAPIIQGAADDLQEFFWNRKRYLVFTDDSGITIYDVQSGTQSKVEMPNLEGSSGSFIFYHGGDVYYFLAENSSGCDRVIQLTHKP